MFLVALMVERGAHRRQQSSFNTGARKSIAPICPFSVLIAQNATRPTNTGLRGTAATYVIGRMEEEWGMATGGRRQKVGVYVVMPSIWRSARFRGVPRLSMMSVFSFSAPISLPYSTLPTATRRFETAEKLVTGEGWMKGGTRRAKAAKSRKGGFDGVTPAIW